MRCDPMPNIISNPPAAMLRLFAQYPEAIEASVDIARRCGICLERLAGQFPLFSIPQEVRRSAICGNSRTKAPLVAIRCR